MKIEKVWRYKKYEDTKCTKIQKVRRYKKYEDTKSMKIQIVWRYKNQQDATIRCLLLTSVSTTTYFGYHYAHLQENKGPLTAFGVLFWFCWMWLVAVVGRCLEGCEHYEGFCCGKLLYLQVGNWQLVGSNPDRYWRNTAKRKQWAP